jgi:hypothetical protein
LLFRELNNKKPINMKFKLFQMFDLELEIAGGKREDFSIVGLINESISFKTKYLLQRVLKKIGEEKEQYIASEKALFTSLGAIEKDGNLVIENTLEDGSPNPAIQKLIEERTQLMNVEVDAGELDFKIEDFDFKSESTYPVFMLLAFD